ncbi:hypothetical protein M9978_02485 [Sphingomonas sp. MG17]|uniref:Uncharacterized protein n=1 Tax=Sphingomonas tagetis TaxID=2949092 RepID=A0A9X2HHI8_9SPHN|nr:hypothetical protein [Sphingomonas tagetis]MCP3729284.1 hypothetical protein [Sphingomonas tagetis]
MTKARPPLSIENALYKVLGRIGIERAAEVTSRGADYLRSLSDPDNRYRLTCQDMLALDDEHQVLTGERPLYETLGLMIDARNAARFSDRAELRRLTVPVLKEAGEAHAALAAATCDGAGAVELRNFVREAEQSVAKITQAIGAAQAMLEAQQQPP